MYRKKNGTFFKIYVYHWPPLRTVMGAPGPLQQGWWWFRLLSTGPSGGECWHVSSWPARRPRRCSPATPACCWRWWSMKELTCGVTPLLGPSDPWCQSPRRAVGHAAAGGRPLCLAWPSSWCSDLVQGVCSLQPRQGDQGGIYTIKNKCSLEHDIDVFDRQRD